MHKTIDEAKWCDRCGNDFEKGKYAWHLPFLKVYVVFCHICYYGLILGFHNDLMRVLKDAGSFEIKP